MPRRVCGALCVYEHKVVVVQIMMKKTDLVDAFKEFRAWTDAMRGTVTMVRTDSESAYVHGAFAKYRLDIGIRASPSASYLKEMNGQAERYFGVFF
mmetsp:Transcript_29759/g.56096  ORF Transcript_29759/g.56096 Transcript_29759/m.56096 type:complete len:96 (-) Transcript_29759:2759-3046(-)